MPDSERELRMRHTSEGAEKVRADLKGIAEDEQKLKGQTEGVSEATDDLNIKKENLTNILNRIHPALGGFADTLANAGELAGELGKANLSLTGILGGLRSAVLKNLDAFKLLGAGGAAVAAVLFLIHTVQKLKAEMQEVLELQEKMQQQNQLLIDRARQFEELIVQAVEAGRIAPPTEEQMRKWRPGYEQLRREGVGAGPAFEVITGQRAPFTPEQLQAISRTRGEGEIVARIREELIKGKTLGTREVGFLGERGFTEEEIASLRRVIRTGSPEQPGALVQPRAVTPDEFMELDGGRLQLLAQQLGLMQFMIDRLGQEPRGLGVELERHEGLIELVEKVFLGVARHSGTAAALAPGMVGVGRAMGRDSNGEATQALNRAAERLEEAARSEAEASEGAAERLERAADRMHDAAEAQSAASERANQNRLGHGSTPRREAIAMREG